MINKQQIILLPKLEPTTKKKVKVSVASIKMGTVSMVYEEKIANSYIEECVESLPSMEQTTKGLCHGEEM